MQQGRWAHRLYLLKDRLQHQGMFPTLVIYYHRIRSMLFSRYTFGRWDLNVNPDSLLQWKS